MSKPAISLTMGTEVSPESGKLPPLALIAGPTASGKSAVAVRLAKALEKQGRRAAVINADSAQVYSDLHVLSARPDEQEMQGVEHLLFGAWDGARACSAADWAHKAKFEIERLHEADAVPILVGGTGLYLRTLLEGIAPIPEIAAEIREKVRALPTTQAYEALQAEDPDRAAHLDPGDSQRIARALEVVLSTGRTLVEWQKEKSGGIEAAVDLHPLILLPPRDWLYERCEQRFEIMLKQGAVEEVEALLACGLSPDLPVMRAIGVPEIAGYLRDELSWDDMVTRGQQATRNYAKRQYTWFRRQPPDHWPRNESESVDIEGYFARLLQT